MLEAIIFYLFAVIMVGSALAILISKNIVRSAIWLLATLVAAAGFYLLLSANYLAAIQLIVYAGGVLVLIVFGVMLTAKSPAARFEPGAREILIGVVVGAVLLVGLLAAMLGDSWPAIPGASPTAEVSPVRTIGEELLTTYLVPFELVSVLLLAVMIGAAYLARPEKR
jgi:NADH-quinone oxidoreductase subunit J